jgi:hypothetical protein
LVGPYSTHGEIRNTETFGSEKLKEKETLGDLGVHGRILLKWNLKKFGMNTWTGFI